MCAYAWYQAVLQVVDKIPTIATQLKIIAAVKATRQGGDGKSWREGGREGLVIGVRFLG